MHFHCKIALFGDLRLIRQDRVVSRFRTHKAASLLAYLALELHRPHAREQLTDLFWPDMGLEAARANLRTALNSLRNQLEPPGTPSGAVLIADRHTIQLNTDAVVTDVGEFDRLLADVGRCTILPDRIEMLTRAIALYAGDVLPNSYEEWALRAQQRYGGMYRDALRRLAAALEESGDFDRALDIARSLTHREPDEEEGHRTLIRLCLRLGRESEALASYESLERHLQAELGASPEHKTRAMVRSLVAASGARTDIAVTCVRLPDSPVVQDRDETARALPVPSLPLMLTRYIGREAEIERLTVMLTDSETRLITLCGPGGIGKTRLAIETVERVSGHFAGRVWFVPLADFSDRRMIPGALASTLKLAPLAHADPIDRVTAALGKTPALLILDNLEHLLWEPPFPGKMDHSGGSAAALVRLLLERAPGLCCLVTSREVLRIEGEQVFPLAPLALPDPGDAAPERMLQNESVALFTLRAQAVRPDFALTARNAPYVVKLCHKLDGIPLAIEMAAAWVRLLTPATMLERLENHIDLLADRRLNLPPRHRSLRATFEWSCERLTTDLSAFFARLSVFRGGWTLGAAETICASDSRHGGIDDRSAESVTEMLASLQERSLLQVSETHSGMRYRFLEPLREFAAEKLADASEAERAGLAHAQYFLKLAESAQLPEFGAAPGAWLTPLVADNDNLHRAVEWSVTANPELGLRLVIALTPYWKVRNNLWEARSWIKRILAVTTGLTTNSYRGEALREAGALALIQGDMVDGEALCRQSLAICRELNDAAGMTRAISHLAGSFIGRKDYAGAQELYEQALEIGRTDGAAVGISITLTNLGVVAFLQNDLDRARALHDEALQLARRGKRLRHISIAALNAAIVAIAQEDFRGAQDALEESLQLYGETTELQHLTSIIEQFGCLASAQDDCSRAIKLFGAAAAIRESIGAVVPFDEQAALDRHLAVARDKVGEPRFASLWNEGRQMSRQQAIAYAGTSAT